MNSRYQPGGDIYARLASQYGQAGADRVARADASGVPYAVNDALVAIRHGDPLSTSTTGIFLDNITSDPLGAPLESANNQIAKAVGNLFKNPWVLLVVAVVIITQLDGWAWIRKHVK